MATTTENLGLTLPAGTDRALVSDLNENFQTLDAFAGQATADIQEAQETANAAAPQSTTYTKDEVDAAIEEAIEHGGGGTTDYTDLTNKPSINGVVLTGNKTTSDLGIEENVQADWSQTDSTADDYIKNKPTIPTVNDATLTIQKNGAAVGTFSANAATAAIINITVPVDAEDVDALPDTTKYGASLALSIDSSTYVVTATLKDQDGNTLGTEQTIDLPLETVVVGGSYDDTTKKIILTLKNGNTIDFSVVDLVSGLQIEITSANKLDADLVDDTTSVHKFVTAADKSAWNSKSDFSGSYNDLTNKPTIPTVDQTYDSTSANAQSGAAVAQAISTKVDKEAGKGLSTNDFTNTDKANLAAALATANAVHAPISRLVDGGVKNLADMSNPSAVRDTDYTPLTDGGLRLSCSNKSWTQYTITVDVTTGKNYVFSLKVANVTGDLSSGHLFIRDEGSTNYSDRAVTTAGEYISRFTPTTSIVRIMLFVNNSSTAKTVSLDAYGMLCTAEDYAISSEFVPYAPSNRELYEMILAMQNGG